MSNLNSISDVLFGNKFLVPGYQRSYSWRVSTEGKEKEVNQFLADLKDFIKDSKPSNYYFGHFILKKQENGKFDIVDGQQRLTTITIFLSAALERVKGFDLSNGSYGGLVDLKFPFKLSTVVYDDQLFQDYVIEGRKEAKNSAKTLSQKRIVEAYDFFLKELQKISDGAVHQLVAAVLNADCSSVIVENEAEAMRIFIFENNRGKKLTNLDNLKSKLIIRISDDTKLAECEKEELFKVIMQRFESIYRSLSKFEDYLNEDNVLKYSLNIYFNKFSAGLDNLYKELQGEKGITTVREFTTRLQFCCDILEKFFEEFKTNVNLQYVIKLSNEDNVLYSFILKSKLRGLTFEDEKFLNLLNALESMFVRSRLTGTRAYLEPRLSDVFSEFNPVKAVERINWMKKQSGWYGYWNDEAFFNSAGGYIDRYTSKLLLWKYENSLRELDQNSSYGKLLFEDIKGPQLEHIAPITKPSEVPESGYGEYDEDFKSKYLDCIGNHLLISGCHNGSIGNRPFEEKRKSYSHLYQQREVQEMTKNGESWYKKQITDRKNKIVNFLLENY